jgi:hypothetical protein
MRLLLMFVVGLLLVLCGCLFFLIFQLKHFGGFLLRNRSQTGASTREQPDGSFEPEWKVSS